MVALLLVLGGPLAAQGLAPTPAAARTAGSTGGPALAVPGAPSANSAGIEPGSLGPCPLQPWEDADPRFWIEEGGERIYFCCRRCIAQWAAGERPATPPPLFTEEASARSDSPLRRLGRLHPAAAHFPVALLLMGALAELLFLLSPRPGLDHAARFNVAAGSLAALPTAALGLAAAWEANAPLLSGDPLAVHRLLALGLVLLSLALLRASERARRTTGGSRTAYRVLLLATALLVAAVGYTGGELAHGP